MSQNIIRGFSGDWRFLSNFYLTEVFYENLKYPSAENAYQAAKSTDPLVRSLFQKITPSESKALGKKIKIRDDWDDVRYKIMWSIVLDKFSRNLKLLDLLIDTGDSYLEETNTWGDTTWGVSNGVGKNWLGKILMDVRQHLK